MRLSARGQRSGRLSMGTDIGLLIERLEVETWTPAFELAERFEDPRTHLGIVQVCWWPLRWDATTIFFGESAVYPFHPGLPTDISSSSWNYAHLNFEDDQRYAGWISFAELELRYWPERTVLMGGSVKARFADLFGDGRQPAPIPALRARGIEEPVLDRVTHWKSKRRLSPEDWTGERARTLERSPLDSDVAVTWLQPLPELFGYAWRDGLAALSDVEEPQRYRLITTLG